MTPKNESHCPLCRRLCAHPFLNDSAQGLTGGQTWFFYQCSTCDLIHRNRDSHLSVPEEQGRYAMHENGSQADPTCPDPGYLAFLTPTIDATRSRVPPGAKGLDFGCGPGPLLARQLTQQGFKMSVFDPLFQPDFEVLKDKYDFITCTEVVEHLREPNQELQLLKNCLKPGGRMIIQTGFHSHSPFASWHYRRDPTHICFFSEKTWAWWSHENQCHFEVAARNVAVIMPTNGAICGASVSEPSRNSEIVPSR